MKNIPIEKIKTSRQVLSRLEELDHQLASSPLDNLRPFNMAYVIVTAKIADSLESNYFANPRLIEDFTVRFADYYFQAINSLLKANADVAPAWSMIISSNNVAASFLILLGANAHINYDLPLALAAADHGQRPAELLSDLVKIDRLLDQAGRQILHSYDEPRQPLRFIKRYLAWLYFWPVMMMIRYWRIKAVYNYRALQRSSESQKHNRRSVRLANRLLGLGKLLS